MEEAMLETLGRVALGPVVNRDGEQMVVVNQGNSFDPGQSCFLCVECGVAHACVFHMQIRTSDVPGHLDARAAEMPMNLA
jgi:hypothetical protein